MPANNPRTPKRSWRGEHAASSRTGKGQPTWKAEKTAVGASPRISRNVRIAVVLVLFLVVIGVLMWAFFIPRPPDPFRLVLIGPGYEQNLAVESDVLAVRTLDDLNKWSKDYNGQHFLEFLKKGASVDVQRPAFTGSADPVADALDKLNKDTVVVFLSGEGGGDEQGAYLLPEDAGPRNLNTVYRIDQALDALGKLKPEIKKLLLLDGSQQGPNWTMGRLHNDFVRSVKNEPKLKTVKNLVVLCSCSEGERSWSSEEYGQTIFGHFVIEGLKGAADVKGAADDAEHCAGGDGNTRITAEELAKYVVCQVDRWARRNRGFDQKPLLIDPDDAASAMELAGADTNAYKEPDPSTLTLWTPPADLTDAWKEHEELARSSPPPAAYTPQQWRVYETSLLRYEHLLRTGGADAAAVRETIRRLHDQIVLAQRLPRDSLTNSLAAPAAFGWTLPDETATELEHKVKELWNDKKTKPEQFQRLLSTMQDAAPNQSIRHLLRVRLIGLLLDRAPGSHDDYLRVCAVLPKLAEPPAPAPAEANFAVMAQAMEAQLPGKFEDRWPVLKQALQVRRSAETAALGLGAGAADLPAYSEQTEAWIAAAVERADANRRIGEDRAFAAVKEQSLAAKALKDADVDGEKDFNYKTIRERAAIIRQAIRARDQALADLPWYTQWLGRRPLSRNDEDQLETLWGSVHDLCDLLEKPDYTRTNDLVKPTEAVTVGMQKLKQRFDAACDSIRSARVLQRDLHELEDLLSTPFIEAATRMTMLADARRISLELLKGTSKAAVEGDDQLQDSAALAKKLGFQQGRLVASVLGKDSEEGKKTARLMQLSEQPLWQPELNAAGDLVARGFQNLARDAAERAEKGRRAPVGEAAAPLRTAALQTRFLDAGEANAWLKDIDPVKENRNVQLHDLLVWQAERTRLDYWASEDPAKPYYRTAGQVYAGDARNLADGGPDLKDEEKTARLAGDHIEDRLNAPDAIGFQWLDGDQWKTEAEKLHLTDDKRIELLYGLAGPKDAPPGRPVAWARPGLKLIAPPEAGEPRSLDRVSDKPGENSVAFTVTLDRPAEGPPSKDATQLPPPAREESQFTAMGLYRGRTLVMDTPVRLYNRPDLVSYQPKEEPSARIAVQATREDFELFAARNSELVMVLDYSGSMKLKVDGESTRKDKVIEQVNECLKSLPKGVRLTVMTFSADSLNDIVVQRENSPWKSEERGPLIDKLKGLSAQGRTPLVQALVKAADQFSREFHGQKSIVVLTDGGDNEFNRQGSASFKQLRQNNADMKKVLRDTFDGSRIQIHVVGFRLSELDDKDEKDGNSEFQEALASINNIFKPIFRPIEKADELAAELKRYFLQVRFWVQKENGDPVDATAKEGLQVSLNETNQRPSIDVPAPANYHVLVEAFRNQDRTRFNLPDQHVHVEPGEVLILDLKDAPTADSQFELRRDVFARSYSIKNLSRPAVDPITAGKNWLMTVLGNMPDTTNRFNRDARNLTVSIENTDDLAPRNGTVRPQRPSLAWFEVAKDGDKKPVTGLRFYPVPNYPAPVWRLNLADWQAKAVPVVNAWWYEDTLPEGVVLRQGREYVRPSELKRKAVEVRPTDDDALTKVIVESVGWETHTVEIKPGEWAADQDCLVVRLRYPQGRPYFVQLSDEIRPAGYEHRFYMEANKYTGVFFGVPPAQVENLAWLKMISVEAAHRKAVRVDGVTVKLERNPP